MNATPETAAHRVLDWTEMGLVPDNVIRMGIRRLLRERLDEISADDCEWTFPLRTLHPVLWQNRMP